MLLSATQKRYLFAIGKLGLEGNEVVSKDIAAYLGVKRPSASKMLTVLTENGLIEKEYYGKVLLTQQGLRLANGLYTNYMLLYEYFHTYLGVGEADSEHDALSCVCELSPDGLQRMASHALQECPSLAAKPSV